jgi:hypothetical protein
VQPEELSQWKISKTPTGIKPATFRLVAQCFNQMCYRVPPYSFRTSVISRGKGGRGIKLPTLLHLMTRLRMKGPIILIAMHVHGVGRETFTLLSQFVHDRCCGWDLESCQLSSLKTHKFRRPTLPQSSGWNGGSWEPKVLGPLERASLQPLDWD